MSPTRLPRPLVAAVAEAEAEADVRAPVPALVVPAPAPAVDGNHGSVTSQFTGSP